MVKGLEGNNPLSDKGLTKSEGFGSILYLDSSGVGALIRFAQHSKTIAREILLSNLAGTPRKVREMSNIIRLFTVVPDVETALKAWE